MIDLSVSLVTHNSAHCLPALFESFAAQQGVQWELFIVDNASENDTPTRLQQLPHGNLTLNSSNVGYGAAHNQNLSRFQGRHVLFLNPDLHFSSGLFAGLVNFLDDNPDVGVVGPKVIEGRERISFPPRHFYPGEGIVALEGALRRKDYAWISGCCMAIRRSVLDQVGGFDSNFFLYQEDTDLCLRARRCGHKIAWRPELEVEHAGLQSQIGLSEYEQARKLFRATALFWDKHYPATYVRSMVRFQYLVTRLILALPDIATGNVKQLRRERIRARRDICREWLGLQRISSFPFDGGTWSIFVRHLQLAALWARTGAFPLDDY